MQTPSHHPPHPRGFTLIEVLTVIAILSILIAFLLPAVQGARRNAKIVQVKTEMGNIAAAIATFKQDFGTEPPSTITLYETGTAWDANSRALISRMWNQYDFAGNYDLNGDGDTSDTFTLNGAECLVFFLGGMADSGGDLIGFSRNPAMPFTASTGNRLNPFFQFSKDRLIDANNNGFREYRDPLAATNISPYVYFSSYDGSGYPTTGSGTTWTNTDNSGLMSRAYYSSINSSGPAASRAHNPSTYQLICAGFDGRLGTGGAFEKGAGTPLPLWGSVTAADRDFERDNITNFSDGLLAP